MNTNEFVQDTVGRALARYDAKRPASSAAPVLAESLTVASPHGQASAGTEYPVGTSIESIVRDILAPSLQPTITPPSMTIGFSIVPDYLPIFEKGSGSVTFDTSWNKNNIEVKARNYNRGQISPAYGTNGFRAGEITNITLNGVQPTNQGGNDYWYQGVPVSETNNKVKALVYHTGGDQPKNSGGNDYDTPFTDPVESNELTIEFVNPWWSNVNDLSTMEKMKLVSKFIHDQYNTYGRRFNFPQQSSTNRVMIDVPPEYIITNILMSTEGSRVPVSSQFSESTVTHQDLTGNNVTYTRYTDNGDVSEEKIIIFEWR